MVGQPAQEAGMNSLYIGIDIAKATFVAAVHGPAGESVWGEFANTPAGFEQWRAQLDRALEDQPVPEVVVVLEPTGGYELALAGFAAEHGWRVSRPNAGRVHDWVKSQGRRAKTDVLDARLLARYGAAQPLAPWRPLPRAYSELESLLLRQEDLETMLQQERNRQAALGLKSGTASVVARNLAAVLTALEQAQAEIRAAIKAHLKAHPALQAKVRRLRTVPGVGAKTVLFVLVVLARWDILTEGIGQAKGLVAYAGLDPKTHDSGTSVHKPARLSRMGNRQMRRKLYLAAFGGVRARRGPLRDFYQRLVGRGKAKKLAITAAARKILIWAWAVYRTDTDFDRKRHIQSNPQPELA
jgi:transposase